MNLKKKQQHMMTIIMMMLIIEIKINKSEALCNIKYKSQLRSRDG